MGFKYVVISDCDLEKFEKEVEDTINKLQDDFDDGHVWGDFGLVGPMVPCVRTATMDGVMTSTIWYHQTISARSK